MPIHPSVIFACRRPRAAVLGALVGLAMLASSGPALAGAADESDQLVFTYGVDGSAWYWQRQLDEEVSVQDLSQRVSLPSPQSPVTLPVAVEGGEPTKVSALRFALAERGVPDGSTVTRFVLTLAEGTEPGDTVPTLNPLDYEVQACPAGAAWSPAEADLWDAQPERGGDCVVGERHEPEVGSEEITASWSFDLSTLAAGWGEDDFTNHGVVLAPVVVEDAELVDALTQTWQVNFLLPRRDDPNTPIDEYEDTADRVVADLAYRPGPAEEDPSGAPEAGVPPGGEASGGTGSGVPDGGAAVPELPADGAASGQAAPVVPVQSRAPFSPRMPWYVWLLLPVALLAVALVRSALLEAPEGTRPGGVIATIRRRNMQRRGGVLPVPAGLLARLRATFSLAGRG